jgi:hypothetical protein
MFVVPREQSLNPKLLNSVKIVFRDRYKKVAVKRFPHMVPYPPWHVYTLPNINNIGAFAKKIDSRYSGWWSNAKIRQVSY